MSENIGDGGGPPEEGYDDYRPPRSPSPLAPPALHITRSPSVTSGSQKSEYSPSMDESDISNFKAANKFLAGNSVIRAESTKSATSAKSTASVANEVSGQLAIGSLRLHSDVIKEEEKKANKKVMRSNTIQRKANATLIITSMPENLFLGLDAAGFRKGSSKIVGVNAIPNGAHFLYGGGESTRSGVWFICGGRSGTQIGEFFVRKWDAYEEVIIEEISAAEVRNQKEEHENSAALYPYNMKENSSTTNLGGHPDPASPLNKIWRRMTFAITGEILSRITGDEWNEWKVNNADGYDYGGSVKTKTFSFVISHADRTFSADVIGEERTQQALDSSDYLSNIIAENDYDGDVLIGELQFVYLTGVLVSNLCCQEQWATMIKVIFKAYNLSLQDPSLFTQLIKTIQAQMTYDAKVLQGSIFDHDPALEHDMKLLLIKFKSHINEKLMDASLKPSVLSTDQKALGAAFEEFETYLCQWDWDLRGAYVRSGTHQLEDGTMIDVDLAEMEAEDERGEFAPVICDENGQEIETLRHLLY